jgi:hypothetical protein
LIPGNFGFFLQKNSMIQEFYRVLAAVVSKNRGDLGTIDTPDAEIISDKHPAVQALGKLFKVTNNSTVTINNSTFGGYFLEKAIILEMAL